jgi:hypothetical protein
VIFTGDRLKKKLIKMYLQWRFIAWAPNFFFTSTYTLSTASEKTASIISKKQFCTSEKKLDIQDIGEVI